MFTLVRQRLLSLHYYSSFLADRINGRIYAQVLRLSVCDVMYCG